MTIKVVIGVIKMLLQKVNILGDIRERSGTQELWERRPLGGVVVGIHMPDDVN